MGATGPAGPTGPSGGAGTGAGGTAQYLAVDGDTVALWTGNQTLNDSGPNGLTLQTGGTSPMEAYVPMLPGLWGFRFGGANNFHRDAGVDAVLDITGPITLQAIVALDSVNVGAMRLMAMESFDINLHPTWRIYFVISTTASSYAMDWAAGAVPQAKGAQRIPRMRPTLVTCTRDASNIARLYLDADLVATSSSLATATTDPDDRLILGSLGNDTQYVNGAAGSFRVKDVAISDADVKADYNATLGPVYGMMP